ncbi:unnamed protein product [Diamesa serratosioi]
MELLLLIPPALGAAAFAVFYFMKSSKEMPKNWKELWIELQVQHSGTQGLIEDLLFRSRNKVELYKQAHKNAVITGGNRGIGLSIVNKLLDCDMNVMLGVRSPEDAKIAIEKFIDSQILTQGKLYYEKCDTGDMESIRTFAEKVQNQFPEIHLLINNAGILGAPHKETKDGFESQLAVNYFGHFLLTHLLMPQLKAGALNNNGKNVRIVNVSSCVNNIGIVDYEDFQSKNYYYPADAYNKSKLAQVLFTKHMEVICKEQGLNIQSHAPHPGIVNTDLFENSSTTYIPWFKSIFYKTPEQGSRTVVYAAISPYLEGKGGTYLSNCFYDRTHGITKYPEQCKKMFDFTCNLLKIKTFGQLN